jgi:two-component system NtrC family sensor kinase
MEADDGQIRHIETRISRLPPAADGTARLLCISHSVDRRHDREDELRQRYEEGRAFVDRSVYGIYRSTAAGRFLYVNRALVRMLGYESAEELYAIDLTTQLYADPAEREMLVRRVQEDRLGDWTHVRWKTKDGSIIVIRVVVNSIKDESGAIRFFEGIVEDVTESLRREEILRRNERMASLGTMLAGVAHELNNPLAAISGFAQIILRGNSLNEEDRGAVDTINHEANRAARIVRDLQTFARERTYSYREEVDLNDVVSYILASHRYKMDTHGIHRDVVLAPALPPVRAERAHVEQILINLMANANQALESITDAPATRGNGTTGREPPTITVRTAVRGNDVVLEVEDNGPGISAENLPRVFDPFFTTRTEGEGTGLGLAVVHGIVTSYNGNLEVESSEGRGTLFRVSFPIAYDEPAEASAESAAAASALPQAVLAEKHLEILIVEDEVAIRRLLARYFESRGHTVTTAEDGITALRHAEQSAFDVVICDLRLPGIDGFEVLRRLREMPTGTRSRCILMSGANAKLPAGPMREALRLAAVVDKPFEIEQLCRAVEG